MSKSREEISKCAVCAECMHCITYTIPAPRGTDPIQCHLCTNSVTMFNPVTGEERYEDCSDVNKYGICPDFKKPELNLLQRMFKVIG